jgi:curved DNA-binding protein CbpA
MPIRPDDPHAELGVPPDATAAEVRQAYRRLLRQHHPDTRSQDGSRNPASDHTLQQVLAAYAALRQRDTSQPHASISKGDSDLLHRHGAGTSRSTSNPPITATRVQWVRSAEPVTRGDVAQGRSGQADPKLDSLIRWLLGF